MRKWCPEIIYAYLWSGPKLAIKIYLFEKWNCDKNILIHKEILEIYFIFLGQLFFLEDRPRRRQTRRRRAVADFCSIHRLRLAVIQPGFHLEQSCYKLWRYFSSLRRLNSTLNSLRQFWTSSMRAGLEVFFTTARKSAVIW